MSRRLVSLPALTARELDVLHEALEAQIERLRRVSLPPWVNDDELILGRAGRIARLRSLDVAVTEARYSLNGGNARQDRPSREHRAGTH